MSFIMLWIGFLLSFISGHLDSTLLFQKELKSFNVDFSVRHVLVSPDQTRLLLISHDKSEIWTTDGQFVSQFNFYINNTSRDIRFSADGTKVIATNEMTIYKCWDAKTGKRITYQQTNEEQLGIMLYSAAYRLFEPVRMSNETEAAFKQRAGDFAIRIAYVFAILHPWVSVPLGMSDQSQQVLTCTQLGDGLSSRTPYMQLWDFKNGRVVKTFFPSTWPILLLEICRKLDRVEPSIMAYFNLLKNYFPKNELPPKVLQKGNNIAKYYVPYFDIHRNSKWYYRLQKITYRLGLSLSIADHYSFYGLGNGEITGAPTAISSDGRYFAHCFGSPNVRIWDLKTGQQSHYLQTNWANQMEFDPSGKSLLVASLIEGSNEQTLSLWDIENNRKRWSKQLPKGDVQEMVISNDGQFALVTSKHGIITMWNLENGILVCRFEKSKDSFISANFLENGKKIITTISLKNDSSHIQIWGK